MRNIISLAAIMLLAAVLVGCGGSESSTTTDQQDQTENTTEQTSSNQQSTEQQEQTTAQTDQADDMTEQFELAKQVILAQGCGSCHTIATAGLDLAGQVGPDLTNEASRNRTAEWLRMQLSNPTSIPDSEVAEGFEGQQSLMPSYDRLLSDEEMDAVIAFLMSLGNE